MFLSEFYVFIAEPGLQKADPRLVSFRKGNKKPCKKFTRKIIYLQVGSYFAYIGNDSGAISTYILLIVGAYYPNPAQTSQNGILVDRPILIGLSIRLTARLQVQLKLASKEDSE
jgi:hypothetical protein